MECDSLLLNTTQEVGKEGCVCPVFKLETSGNICLIIYGAPVKQMEGQWCVLAPLLLPQQGLDLHSMEATHHTEVKTGSDPLNR